ncbi:MAG: hypothetical protein H6709_05955 [Kofleriaceae bacterium]|nr:hypothetical protein [Myxococcales bacterium]MCB9560452.1 hypothetical protein [Kofleriaceae bacterium]MCB9571617.1 hypothetical protein [Kofleriaceae bacterium]
MRASLAGRAFGTIGLVACTALIAACATANQGGGDDDVQPDSSTNPTIDAPPGTIDAPPGTIDAAPPIDAPPQVQTVTLSQNTSMTVASANSVACSNSTTGYTTENSYYRVFPLSSAGITTTFTANRVDFGIEQATGGSGATQTVQVRIYSMAGTALTSTSQLTLLSGQNVAVPDSALAVQQVTLTTPATVAANLSLVAEVFVPDGTATSNTFFMGSNASGESGPSYIRAPSTGCDITQPVTLSSLGYPTVNLILTVTGTTP